MTWETFRTGVVSTAHLPEELAQYMEESYSGDDPYPQLIFEKLTYGYRIWTNSDPRSVPADIRPLIEAAKKEKFKWVEFDCDASELEGFETWDW